MQALYQWDLNGTDVRDIETQFLETQEMGRVDIPYFTALLHGIPAQAETLDDAISNCLDRPLADLDPIERAICRLGAYELQERHDIPVRVVINESVEITRKFGADQGHRFVNGVMDKLARQSRPLEMGTDRKT